LVGREREAERRRRRVRAKTKASVMNRAARQQRAAVMETASKRGELLLPSSSPDRATTDV
jgi:hypothetical protein